MNVAQKDVYERASRAMFLLTKKCVTLHLPVDVMIDLFDKTVIPVLTYGCEIWGHENLNIIEPLEAHAGSSPRWSERASRQGTKQNQAGRPL